MHNLHTKLQGTDLQSLKQINEEGNEKKGYVTRERSIKHHITQKARLQTTLFNQSLVSDLAFSFGSYKKIKDNKIGLNERQSDQKIYFNFENITN